MKLINAFGSERETFTAAGYHVPAYDREALKQETFLHPRWLHFGPGNIFRAYQAGIWEQALEKGQADSGVIVAEAWDFEVLDKGYRPYDNLALSVVLHADGQIEKNVIGCITESLKCAPEFTEDWIRLCDIFRNPSLEAVSFSITEKGYLYTREDLEKGLRAELVMGRLTALLFERFKEGLYPLTLQSMDNCAHNGDHVRRAILAYAENWVGRGLVPEEFHEYLADESIISCPWCMIDKITPRPSPLVREMLLQDGFEDTELSVTEKQSYTAAFVNAEEVGYLVIEDAYVNGKLPFEAGGAVFTSRETVDRAERMKVGTCLNPLHTALGTFGCPLGFTLIQDEMKDPDLLTFLRRMVEEESMPVAVDPGILNPRDFVNECIEKRFVNPYMPDTPQRITTDNSQAIRIRYSGTLQSYLDRGEDITRLTYIPLVYAGYARYLSGLDDQGQPFELSPDPLKEELHEIVKGLRLTEDQDFSCLQRLFSREDVFHFDLYRIGLGEKCEALTRELFAGPGAIRRTLHKYVNQ